MKVIIIGAGGHGKVVAEIVKAKGDQLVGFLDDDISKNTLGKTKEWSLYKDCYFIIGIGDTKIREKISNQMEGAKWYTAIHPTAVISNSAIIEEGTVIGANAVVNTGAHVGMHCIINTGSIVEHDNKIGDFVHIAVGAKLGGEVTIGRNTWVGIGSIVCSNVTVCCECYIAAGAVVVKNIDNPGKYAGIPAVKMNEKGIV